MTINLSGFLKGYALEKIRELLQQYEIENALVNMGNSSVLALGHHPLADGWKVNFGQSAVTQAKEWPEIFLKRMSHNFGIMIRMSGNILSILRVENW